MAMKSPYSRFCYRCDAITPSECKCRKNAYCVGCQTLYQPPEKCNCSHFVRERPTDIVGINTDAMLGIKTEQTATAAVRRNEEENRRTWNAAIEAAALSIPKYEDDGMSDIVEIIRRLKK